MILKKLSQHPYRVFAWVLATLLFMLVLMEGWRYAVKPNPDSENRQLAVTLDEVAEKFADEREILLSESQELANRLEKQLIQGQSQGALYETILQHPRIWGSGLYQGTQPLVWNGFSLDSFRNMQPSDPMDTFVEVRKQNNVLLWITHIAFWVTMDGTDVPYHLYTAKRISQTNALPIAEEQEYSILRHVSNGSLHSINISIYDPLPANYADYRVLHSYSGDSLGVVYATSKNVQSVRTNWKEANRFWRAVFVLSCFIVIGLLLYLRLEMIPAFKALLFQIAIVAIGWMVFNQINIAENWLPALMQNVRPDRISSYQQLCNFAVDGLFFLIIAFTLKRHAINLDYQIRSTDIYRSISLAIVGGLLNLTAVVLTITSCYKLAHSTTIPLLTLQIFPGTGTILFYLVIGLMLWALTMTLLVVNQFLLCCFEDQYKLIITICTLVFIGGLFIMHPFVEGLTAFNWVFNITIIFFGLILALSYGYFRYSYNIPHTSPLRTTALYSLLISIVGITLIYQAKIRTIDSSLIQQVGTYTEKDDTRAEELTQELLTSLESNFRELTVEDLRNRASFIQAQFTQSITSIIPSEGVIYSYDLQMIDSNLNLIADYSTNLNSPDWVRIFDMQRLKAGMDIEQITQQNIRPIIQQPDLEDDENYQTFYRGWIPIFGSSDNDPIAWILCSIYQERPDFNKPMRAMIASLNYQDWEDSYVIQEYINAKLRQTIYMGVREQYPSYNRLQDGERSAVESDSTVFYTSTENEETYRNVLVSRPLNRVIKGTTMMPGYQNILFSFFRLSFTLLVTGFVIMILYRWGMNGELAFFGDDERFRYRILDSFLLATLLFLILLIFATHFAIQQQNTGLVEEQLYEKLETITSATEQDPALQIQISSPQRISLDSLTTPLNVDATFYQDRTISVSTAPQIYEQHLLPETLPYPVYSDLFLSQKRNALDRVMLGEQALLIGYRSILSEQQEPIATIAIPTFVQSPKFNKQLLETTSFLIILYLVVFGVFILGTFFISRQLTRPIEHIQEGLNKISKGNLDTTIPATSNDEIGSLAVAYNEMVSRLKELQEELAEAEREAAWKEMAQQVAHEIKNPLTPMKLNIQHLERQIASGDYTTDELKAKIRTMTQNLTVQIQSLNNIASDFSKFSKPIEEEEFQSVNINALLQSVTDLYQHDEQTTILVHCQADPATVWGAEDELRRVIINLVKNAHEAMPDGGTLSLQTYLRQNHLFVEAEDNGTGISEEDKPKIFVPNFSTKSSGTGLGLAICKKIVEAHNGSISFASIEGEGTTFVIKLPLAQSYA